MEVRIIRSENYHTVQNVLHQTFQNAQDQNMLNYTYTWSVWKQNSQ
jgi:hypothetical protein